jgi:hypothetical protein
MLLREHNLSRPSYGHRKMKWELDPNSNIIDEGCPLYKHTTWKAESIVLVSKFLDLSQ